MDDVRCPVGDETTRPAPRRLPPDLRWLTMDAADTHRHPGLINDLIAKETDGVTVRGVFDRASIDSALELFTSLTTEWSPQVFGSMLGMPLNQVGSMSQDRTPHLDDTERCRQIYARGFGFDPHERLVEVLNPMQRGLEISVPMEGDRPYNPGNIRRYDPGLGGLRAHAGNEFIDLVRDGAMSHLLRTTCVVDHLSYFVVLQPSVIGGRLSVFDLLWDEHVHEDDEWAGSRDDAWFDDIPALQLSPGPGDLILFGGGWRWHRVRQGGGPGSAIHRTVGSHRPAPMGVNCTCSADVANHGPGVNRESQW